MNTALRVPLVFVGEEAEATWYFAFGATHQAARTALTAARGTPSAGLASQVEATDAAWVASLALLPPGAPEALRRFAKRAFLYLRDGTDRNTGAIVASIARQPFYQLDWPRDGAFFNAALDLAGLHGLVAQRLAFYAGVLRDARPSPPLGSTRRSPGGPSVPPVPPTRPTRGR